jgi:hypothetical protein
LRFIPTMHFLIFFWNYFMDVFLKVLLSLLSKVLNISANGWFVYLQLGGYLYLAVPLR